MNNTNDQIGSEIEFSDPSSLEELPLIKGTFAPSEAKEVLMSLINSKISFHNMKNLRSYEHNGSQDQESKQRTKELKKTRKHLLTILENAENDGNSVRIESQIKIEFCDGSK
ncbi:MAG: hypothetical protein U5J63_13360 [Fodinibius sp.]|nr:hypothetical protein [Fodinibius sp.]